MARIRSIKPEYWTDSKIASVSNNAALFFIGLWNFASDEGIIENDTRALSLLMPRFRPQVVQHMLSSLFRAGLIARSQEAELWLIKGWRHQRIDKPRAGKYKAADYKWISYSDSETSRDDSTQGSRIKERIKDRRGSRISVGVPEPFGPETPEKKSSPPQLEIIPKEPPPEPEKPPEEKLQVRDFIAKFCEAYKAQYGTNPIIMGAQAGAAKAIVKALGSRISQEIIPTYLAMRDQWFVTKRHDLVTLMQNINAVKIKHDTGASMTKQDLRSMEDQEFRRSQRERLEKGLI